MPKTILVVEKNFCNFSIGIIPEVFFCCWCFNIQSVPSPLPSHQIKMKTYPCSLNASASGTQKHTHTHTHKFSLYSSPTCDILSQSLTPYLSLPYPITQTHTHTHTLTHTSFFCTCCLPLSYKIIFLLLDWRTRGLTWLFKVTFFFIWIAFEYFYSLSKKSLGPVSRLRLYVLR